MRPDPTSAAGADGGGVVRRTAAETTLASAVAGTWRRRFDSGRFDSGRFCVKGARRRRAERNSPGKRAAEASRPTVAPARSVAAESSGSYCVYILHEESQL
jgi:hypothetical protein